MKNNYAKQFFAILFSLFLITDIQAEGTFQLTPTMASDNTALLQIWGNNEVNRNSFTYGCTEDKKLYFSVAAQGETVYFGMNVLAEDLTGTSTLWYRIISPSGTRAFPASGWQQVTNTGAGSIAAWNEAAVGPNNITGGSGGYTPLSFTPLEGGDFYIEFYRNSVATEPANTPITATSASIDGQEKIQTRLRFFDVTVTDAPNGNNIPGRLFSKTWDINTNGNNVFAGLMYVYTEDGITSSVNFNKIRSTDFVVTSNATGVSNTGAVYEDTKSVNGAYYYGLHKIFLNAPDADSYATGIYGDILNKNNITITGMDPTQLCINVVVDKNGQVEILLNFNGIPGYQQGTSDVLLSAHVSVGTNCIPWNCKDGLGNIVASGTSVELRVDYSNGKSQLALYNVANNPYGLIVSIISPAGIAPLLLWNDENLTYGTTNLAGCTTGSPTATSGCHKWGSDANGNIPSGNAPADWGLDKTINTTWYPNYINVSATYSAPGNFVTLSLPSANKTVASTDAPFELTGGSPEGGTYSGDGVTDNMFDPAAAGPGEHVITYTYTFNGAVATLANARTTAADYTYTSTQKISVSSTTTAVITAGTVTRGIYPNPNSGSFHVVGSAGSNLVIYDARGQIIQSAAVTDINQLIRTDLKQGIYQYILRGTSGTTNSGSFIVQ